MGKEIQSHRDLRVYQMSFSASMKIFEVTKAFPKQETYSLIDQIRRSSRSVSGNIAEAFRRRLYTSAFSNCLNISEAEAAETQVWLEYSRASNYIPESLFNELMTQYDHIINMLVKMRVNSGRWNLG
jgi:four helix bundle protein